VACGRHGRSNYIPPERRLGLTPSWRWSARTINMHSEYYEGNSDRKKVWDGYDTIAQTRAAINWLRSRRQRGERPFLLALSWGTPHEPYELVPDEYRAMFDPEKIILRPNVPAHIGKERRGGIWPATTLTLRPWMPAWAR